MGKHRLELATEDILQHYGIKGMKWDVRRTDEEIAAANGKIADAAELLENAGDEVMGNESVGEELGDVLDIIFGGEGDIDKEIYELADATKDKLEDISADVKKRGTVMLERMFGKSQSTVKGKTLVGNKEVVAKKSDVKEVVNPFTGKPVKFKNKDGQEATLMRKKIKLPKNGTKVKKGAWDKVDRDKLQSR